MSEHRLGGSSLCSRRGAVGLAALAGLSAALMPLTGCAPASGAAQADTAVKVAEPRRASSIAEARAGSGTASSADGTAASGPRTAVVYFSVPLTDAQSRDADSGASIVMSGQDVLGNVQFVAQFVAAATGGDLLRIEPEVPYPTDEAIFDYALDEQHADARPAISLVAADGTVVESLDAYDTVCVGYPIWWYELPMPLHTFFETFDLSGKVVAPFVVHGGSGLSGTVEDIEELQPEAQVAAGLSVSRDVVEAQGQADADAWVGEQGL